MKDFAKFDEPPNRGFADMRGRRVSGGAGLAAFVQFFFLRHGHFVRAPRDVIVTPFDDDGITALVLDGVGDVVELVAHVLNIHLLAGGVGTVHTHHQHVGTWME